MLEKIVEKLTSGRFLFTVITAVVFGWATVANKLSNEQIVSIIMLVVSFYFSKQQEEKK